MLWAKGRIYTYLSITKRTSTSACTSASTSSWAIGGGPERGNAGGGVGYWQTLTRRVTGMLYFGGSMVQYEFKHTYKDKGEDTYK